MIEGWHYSIAGAGVGVVVGMTGIGGGALMTPILVMLFGVSPARFMGQVSGAPSRRTRGHR